MRRSRLSGEIHSKEPAMAAKLTLDSFDKKILDCLQEAGIIRARVALLERKAVNAGVTVFVAVRTNQHNAQWLGRFAKAVASFPEVMDCYRMSGEIDYLFRLALPDIEAYDTFYKRLIARVELSDVTSMFAMEEIKSTTRLPLNYLP
jgi:Lrp/AsnC family transcriptional regulator